jgi:hypothetical protein
MEAVVERSNLRLAHRRVVGNKGAAGVDGLTVSELAGWLKVHWPSVKAALLEGRYLPQAVRAVDIPKPQGGVRTLGIPTPKSVAQRVAANSCRWWHNSAMLPSAALPNAFFDSLGNTAPCRATSTLDPPDADPLIRWCVLSDTYPILGTPKCASGAPGT